MHDFLQISAGTNRPLYHEGKVTNIDEPICMIDVADFNTVYYYHFDGLGSTAFLKRLETRLSRILRKKATGTAMLDCLRLYFWQEKPKNYKRDIDFGELN